jgi:hypothetical protein
MQMNDFLSIGICLYTGSRLMVLYPLNLILFPLAKLFDLDAPIVQVTVFDTRSSPSSV